jgi:anti-sigma-K factor RskA
MLDEDGVTVTIGVVVPGATAKLLLTADMETAPLRVRLADSVSLVSALMNTRLLNDA